MSDNLLDMNFDDVYDFENFQDGEQATVRIKSAETKLSKANKPMLVVVVEDPTNPRIDDIYNYMLLPTAEMRTEDPKSWNKRAMRMRDFYECFGIDSSQPLEVDKDMPGLEGDVIMSLENDDEGNPRNTIKKFVK